jgi:hypothetical protein
MFSQKIIDADPFTELPPTTQCLYFHLCMNADDDGFNNRIRHAMFNAHADNNDFNLLVQKRFIIPFESGVIVIKHWRMHNLIRGDRYHETEYIEEKASLLLKENGVYTDNFTLDNQVTTIGLPSDNQMEPEVRLGKDSIGKVREGKASQGKAKKSGAGYFDDNTLNDAFIEFVKMRKSIKKPLTENAIKRAMTKLDKLAGPDNELAVKIINQSVDHCWQDFYPLKEIQTQQSTGNDFMDKWANA